MTTDKIIKEFRRRIDAYSELSKALGALYVEVDASIAEDVEVKVAKALKQAEDKDCYFNFGNKTCRGKKYTICSAHINKIAEDKEYFKPELSNLKEK